MVSIAVEPRARRSPLARAELLGLGALLLGAALLRLPHLWNIPQFTDETLEALVSFKLYQGRAFPLHNEAKYLGALFNYLEAAAFVVTGPSIYTPRLVVWLLGTLTVGATYLFARETLGSPAAWLAAALLATSGVHIGANSHVAWGQCVTPLFLTLALWQLRRAVGTRKGAHLAWAGLLFGLALQTHPTVLFFLAGATVYALLKAPAFLRTRWPYLAAVLLMIGYGNMLIYNLTSSFDSIKAAQSRDAAYTDTADQGTDSYAENQRAILLTLLRFPGGAVDARPDAAAYLADPSVLLYGGLTLVGLVLLARRGDPLPLLVIVAAAMLMPLTGARHDLLPRQGRYLSPLLPLGFTALAAAAWALRPRVDRLLAGRGASARTQGALLIGAVVLLAVFPLLPLARYYGQNAAVGLTNDRLFRLLHEIEASRQNGEFVLLDFQLAQDRLGGGGTALRTMDYFLTVRGISHDDLTLDPDRIARRYGGGGILVVVAEKTYRNVGAQLPLRPVEGQATLTPPAPYGVYRLGPAGTEARPSS